MRQRNSKLLLHRTAAWAVHLYTALGGPLGAWALFAIFDHNFRLAWLLIAITIVIDSTDGFFARTIQVSKIVPSVDGRRLDDIIDYINWVLIPIILLVVAGILPAWALPFPLLASSYGFAQTQAKTKDHYFLGFPSYWSIVGFYFYMLSTSIVFNTILVLLLSVFVFFPIRFPYPTQTKPFRPLTLLLCSIWGVMLFIVILGKSSTLQWLTWSSLFLIPYYIGLTILLWWRCRFEAIKNSLLGLRDAN
jgi:phosphatidylcholine synthase